MSDPGKAVFLSYASQDSAPAKKICEALRAAGIEVWFDQNELVGGDAWDQKIRKQIKECALFMPVISANTNARLEGYFRREWRLAVERMHDMDDEVAFLLPVVIDDTTDAAARVPERFRERQWIRIGSADSLRAFAERAGKLLAGEAAAEPRTEDRGRRTEDRGQRTAKSEEKRRGPKAIWLIPAIVGALAGVGLPVWKMIIRPAAQATAPVSEARKLAEQARVLMEEDDLNRQNFHLAEQLLERAVGLDPTDGHVLAIYAQLSLGFLRFGFEQSPARDELARAQAERAIKLSPEDFEARYALAYYYYRADPMEGERRVRELLRQRPDDRRLLRALGLTLRRQQRHEDSIAIWRQADALPGGDALAQREIALTLLSLGRAAEAETAVDESLRLGATVRAWLLKAEIQMMGRGDLEGAEASLRQLPPWAWREDRSAFIASQLRLWQRNPNAAIATLERVPRDFLADNLFTGPKSYLIGVAHAAAGRDVAARREWEVALAVVERELAASPRSVELLYWRAQLHAILGRHAEARQARTSFEQTAPDDRAKGARLARIDVALGEIESALDHIEPYLTDTGIWLGASSPSRMTVHSLRLDPVWAPLHGNARYEKLVATPSGDRRAEDGGPK